MSSSGIITEIIIVLLLILLNGLFSLSEMAVVSARRNRLQQRASAGDQGAARALELAENPNRFLSTVQIGITSVGILSGAFGGATVAEQISAALKAVPALAPYSQAIGIAVVVIVITYLSLVLGELVPKRLALNSAEVLAARLAPLMSALSKVNTPMVKLLSASTELVLRLIGARPSNEPEVTEEDLKSMIDQGTENGVLEESEQDMVERIFRLSDRSVSALITPRTDIVFIEVDSTEEDIYRKIVAHPFARFPVIQGSTDNIIGIVSSRDLLLQRIEGRSFDVTQVMQEPLFIPETTAALQVLELFRTSGAGLAVVIDEYGGVMGLVSMTDIMKAIVGEVAVPGEEQEAEAFRRDDGSWLFDGMIQVDELRDYLGNIPLPDEDVGNYETLGGLIMTYLGRIPASGDYFEWQNLRFEVVDMDGRRVDKVLVTPKPQLS